MSLKKENCVPCREGADPLGDEKVKEYLGDLDGWSIKDGKLFKEFDFKDFKKAVAFVNKVAKIAEQQDHHPNIYLHSWNKVNLTLYTHKINGLHKNDFILASKIDSLL